MYRLCTNKSKSNLNLASKIYESELIKAQQKFVSCPTMKLNVCLLTPDTPDDPLDIDSSESEYGLLAIMFTINFLLSL